MTQVDPPVYFRENNCLESLILSIDQSIENPEVSVVIDYADINGITNGQRSFDGFRRFLKFLFSEVDTINHSNILYKRGFKGFDPDSIDFQSSPESVTIVIESLNLLEERSLYKMALNLGSYGQLSFVFRTLLVTERLTVCKNPHAKKDWVYVDASNNSVVDFYHPFS